MTMTPTKPTRKREPRIAVVGHLDTTDVRYVRAVSKEGALAHVTKPYTVRWATPEDMLGVKAEQVEDAGDGCSGSPNN